MLIVNRRKGALMTFTLLSLFINTYTIYENTKKKKKLKKERILVKHKERVSRNVGPFGFPPHYLVQFVKIVFVLFFSDPSFPFTSLSKNK